MKSFNLTKTNVENIIKRVKLFPAYLFNPTYPNYLHLYLLMPVLGVFTLIYKKRVQRPILLCLALFFFSGVVSAFFLDFYSVKRSLITLFTIMFSTFLVHFFSKVELDKLTLNSLFLVFGYFIYECFTHSFTSKTLFEGFSVPRVNGILAYSNHTALLFAGLGILLLIQRKYWIYPLTWIGIITNVSRTAIVVALLGTFVLFLKRFSAKTNRKINYIILAVVVASPIWLLTLEKVATDNQKLLINSISGGRYVLQHFYLSATADHPFGSGTDSATRYYKDYVHSGSSIITKGLFVFPPDVIGEGPHSTFIQVLVEQGVLGYLFFLFFLIWLYQGVTDYGQLYLYGFGCILIGGMTMYILNEFIFLLLLAYVLNYFQDIFFKKIGE